MMTMVTGILATMALAAGLPTFAGDCPAAVTSAVEKAHAGAKALACKSEREGGATLYEVELRTADGRTLELEVHPDGMILLTEEQIVTSEVPAAVSEALHTTYAGATVRDAERLTAANGEISYEISFTSGGRKQSMTVTEAGALVEVEADDDQAVGPDEDD